MASILSCPFSPAASEFWVTVQRTEAAERCRLHGRYVLKADQESLVLRDPRTKQPLYTWPYRLLRRYGRDKVMFSFEAGRRCGSGPGNFTFETKQGNELFRMVEASIQEQKAQVEENRQSCSSLDSDGPGMALIRSGITDLLSLEGEEVAAEGLSAKLSSTPEERDAAAAGLKGRTLPEPPAPQANTPPRSPLPKVPQGPLPPAELTSVYSEPLDSVRSIQPVRDPLYSDPVDSRRRGMRKEEAKARKPTLLYSGGLYEQVGRKEHIYDEPEGRVPCPVPAAAGIYDEACLPGEAWRTQGLDGQAGYEFPYSASTDDYAVPAFQQRAGPKGPKPVPAPKPQVVLIPKVPEKSLDSASKRRATSAADPAGVKLGSNNNNNTEPVYSRVLKPLPAPPAHLAVPASLLEQELSVDGIRLLSVYEDLGEI
uniref:Docking protein 1 n=1 Tax=Sphenodon punctatus TaxID=8508 RepID=A0A8D0H987_SPHPU